MPDWSRGQGPIGSTRSIERHRPDQSKDLGPIHRSCISIEHMHDRSWEGKVRSSLPNRSKGIGPIDRAYDDRSEDLGPIDRAYAWSIVSLPGEKLQWKVTFFLVYLLMGNVWMHPRRLQTFTQLFYSERVSRMSTNMSQDVPTISIKERQLST